ncbi:MAG: ATP-dependent helicase [Bacteroidales bacterium]|nr:ATP-dependent helicase [Bacteroidales bacterium]
MNLGTLNERQRAAVTCTEGRVRVVAGAGSGKTKALSYRYAFIVNEIGIDPANILCLTFTNKAAQEMRSRISQLVPPGYTNDFVCTIHGFCVRFLREEIHRLGYPKNFQILDEEDMKTLVRQVLTENNAERSVKTVRQLIEALAAVKSKNQYIPQYLLSTAVVADRTALSQSVQLLYKQKDKLALDFDDLVYFTCHILHSFDDVREKWQERMNYVMVDEAQDCNSSDWDIVNTLSAKCGNLFIVGDPDQSIYEWRGAKPDMFVAFAADKDIILDENYRSTPGILDVANSIIVNNKNRIDKKMFTKKGEGDTIVHFHGANENQEAQWVCTEIAKRIEVQHCTYADFAVLFRASHLSRVIEQAFIRAGIPYVMWGGVRFFERLEVKDCISYLRLVASDDDLAFERVINTPSRKVGKITLELITAYASTENTTLYQALKNHIDDPKLDRQALHEFVSLIEECRSRIYSASVCSMLEYILEKTGLKKEYRDDNDEQRLENITELVNSIRMYEAEHLEWETTALHDYLQDIALYTNADYRKETNKVKLMTVHQSKGLEFPYVFIIGLSDGIFPNARSIRERKKNALEEERRLMYVATTRAEKCLFMTESEGYNMQAQQEKLPSRFIAEIKRELFVTEGEMDEALWQRLQNQVASEGEYIETETHEKTAADESFHVGSRVNHKLFGDGEVLEISESGSCKVKFDSGSVRFLRQDILSIQKSFSVNISTDKKHLS